MRRFWMAVLAAAAVAAPATAQTFAEASETARRLEHGGIGPFAGVSTMGALDRRWSVTTFYVSWSGQGTARRPTWLARRATGDLKGQHSVAWAAATACPALVERLGELGGLKAPAVEVPGLGPARDIAVVTDGVGYRLWARWGRYPGTDATGDLELSGNVDSPLASWTDATAERLEPCWRPET